MSAIGASPRRGHENPLVIQILPRHTIAGFGLCTAAVAAELSKRHEVFVCAGRLPQASSAPRRGRIGLRDRMARRGCVAGTDARAVYQNRSIDKQFDEIGARPQTDIAQVNAPGGCRTTCRSCCKAAAPVVFTHDFWLTCPRRQHLCQTELFQCHEVNRGPLCERLRPCVAPPHWPSWTRIRHPTEESDHRCRRSTPRPPGGCFVQRISVAPPQHRGL